MTSNDISAFRLSWRLSGIYRRFINRPSRSTVHRHYWIERYGDGGNSNDGSYGVLAEFKAEVLNDFVQSAVQSVIEFGSGDGNQLRLAEYPLHCFDVSPDAIAVCRERYADDDTKSFLHIRDYAGQRAELTLSLDVIFHLIEDDVYEAYMHRLFDSSDKFVIIYSSNTGQNHKYQAPHVRHREFRRWVTETQTEWELTQHIPNRFPFKGDTVTGSPSDFYIYAKG